MRYLNRALICAMLLALAPAASWAEEVPWEITKTETVESPPASVTLEYKPQIGEYRYGATFASQGVLLLPGQTEQAKLQTNSEMVLKQRVKDYDSAEGVWSIEWSLVKGTMTSPDFDRATLQLPRIELRMDKTGAVRQVKGLEMLGTTPGLPRGKALGEILSQLRFPGFPSKALAAGDTWDQQYALQIPGCDAVSVKSVSQLEGFARIDNVDCAKIRTTYEAPFAFPADDASPGRVLAGTEKAEFYTYFDYAGGKVVQSHGTITLSADTKLAGDTPAEPSAAESPEPKPAPAEVKHDLSIEHHIVMRLQPQATSGEKQP